MLGLEHMSWGALGAETFSPEQIFSSKLFGIYPETSAIENDV